MQLKRYEPRHIEICKECNGTGLLLEWDKDDMLHQLEPTEKMCFTCAGTGRVFVSKETTIFVEPYKNEVL